MTRPSNAISLAGATPRALLFGAGAGVAATLAMSGVMLMAQRAGLLGRSPPRHIVERALGRLHVRRELAPWHRQVITALAHLGFGASQGALYAVLHQQWGSRLGPQSSGLGAPSAATGVPFALVVWAASYAGWIPALGILPPPSKDRPGRPTAMILAHVVYGAALASTLRRLPFCQLTTATPAAPVGEPELPPVTASGQRVASGSMLRRGDPPR